MYKICRPHSQELHVPQWLARGQLNWFYSKHPTIENYKFLHFSYHYRYKNILVRLVFTSGCPGPVVLAPGYMTVYITSDLTGLIRSNILGPRRQSRQLWTSRRRCSRARALPHYKRRADNFKRVAETGPRLANVVGEGRLSLTDFLPEVCKRFY